MKILVIHSHNANRGDEAALRAMVDELNISFDNLEIVISNNGFTQYPNMPDNVKQIDRFPKLKSKIAQAEFMFALKTKGKFVFTKEAKEFMSELKSCDLVLHAPGGPSIGDTYLNAEKLYLWRLKFIKKIGKPYMFYAPSMGPFKNAERNDLRKEVLEGAERIVLRDPISFDYVSAFVPNKKVELALDSALQHDVDDCKYEEIYENYTALKDFIKSYTKCIGITITDLKWHPVHGQTDISVKIEESFHTFIKKKVEDGYGIVFVPQLYGTGNDTRVMNKFMLDKGTFMIDANNNLYDTYFQQFVIGKLYAVVGMRYHSNIFSAKMGTPFVSVSYEQKMKGFMKSVDLENYCVDLQNISYSSLDEKFTGLEQDYDSFRNKLLMIHNEMKNKARYTTDVVCEVLTGKDA